MKLLFILLFLASCSEPQKNKECNCKKAPVVESPKFKEGDCITNSHYEFELPTSEVSKITKVGKFNYQYKEYLNPGKFYTYETSFYYFDNRIFRYRIAKCPKKLEKVK